MKGNHNIIPFTHVCIITVQPGLMDVCKIVIKFYFLCTRTQIIHILLTANTILKLVQLHKAVASEIRRQWEIATIFFCAFFRLNVPQVFGKACTYCRAGVMINLQLPTLVFLWTFEAGANRDSILLQPHVKFLNFAEEIHICRLVQICFWSLQIMSPVVSCEFQYKSCVLRIRDLCQLL